MENEENPIKKNLEEQFRDLIPDEHDSGEVKKAVFQTLDTLNLIGDIADLFTDKFTRTEATFFDIISEDDELAGGIDENKK